MTPHACATPSWAAATNHKADLKTADALRGLTGDSLAWCASSPRR